MSVPSLLSLCILALAPYADQLAGLEWTKLPFRGQIPVLDVDAWTVLIHLFSGLPPPLCSFSSPRLPRYRDGFLTVLSLPMCNHLTPSLLRSTPSLAALDASSTSLSSLPPLVHLRILYLRNCRQITDHILPSLLSLPLLSVIDLSGTRCTTAALLPFAPSTLTALFQPSIQASLASLAALYSDIFPSPLYTLTYLPPRPPKPTPRKSIQDSFVVFSSSSTKIGNTNTLMFDENTLRNKPLAPPRSLPRPPLSSPSHLHRPPPPLPSLHQTTSKPKPPTAPASLNLQSHKARLARKGIDALIKLRSTPSLPTPLPSNPTFTSSTKRNPFKRPLNPISSFPPPLLPPSLVPRDERKKPKLSVDPKTKPDTNRPFDWKAWGATT